MEKRHKLVLFANQVDVDSQVLVQSEQGQVFFATDRQTKKKVVIKQINISSSSYTLIKEL
jgi:serine/threonine protein kinase